jgi:hypothetical protein
MTKEKRIYFHSKLKKYQVMIWYGGKNLHIGYRDNLEDAIDLRDRTYLELGINPLSHNKIQNTVEELDNEDQRLLRLQNELNEKGIIPK